VVDGASGFQCRGGSGVRTSFCWNEATLVYNASICWDSFSVLSIRTIKDVKLSQGSHPHKYGDGISSILDVPGLKEGNSKKMDVSGGVGTIFYAPGGGGSAHSKTKASFIVAGAPVYIDVLARPFVRHEKRCRPSIFTICRSSQYQHQSARHVYVPVFSEVIMLMFDKGPGIKLGERHRDRSWNHI